MTWTWLRGSQQRHGAAVVAGLGLVLALLGGAPAQASIVTAERVNLPPSGTVTIAGHGYGHGIGLSQYGARGAATQGVGYRAILDFYYPGTAHTGQRDSPIRALVSADTDNDVRVVAVPGMTVRDAAGTVRTPQFAGRTVTQWRVVRSGADLHVDGLSAGSWVRWSTLRTTHLDFATPGDTVQLVVPDGTRREYRGLIRAVADGSSPGLRSVNQVSMESYLRSVVPAESPSSWPYDALRAQAVAARTYASFDRRAAGSRAWDTCDTTQCQVYRGYRTLNGSGSVVTVHEAARTDTAIRETAGQIRTYGGAPAFTQFSSSNGGWTKTGSQPYLVARADPWDAVGNPVHSWSVSVSVSQFAAAFPGIGQIRSIEVRTRTANGEWGGRVESVTVTGTQGQQTTTGAGIRSALGLRSDWWKITGSTRLDTDFSTDGRPDLLVQKDDGALDHYEGTGAGTFGRVTQVGEGWQAMRIAVRANDLTGNGRVDVLAVDAAGRMWRYPINGAGRFGPRVAVGPGWGSMTTVVAPGDVDGDGDSDILAVDNMGTMWLYAGNGRGGFGSKVRVGPGWGSMTNVVGGGDWNDDGHSDFLATDAAGTLFLYRGNGKGGFAATPIGQGWSPMRLVSTTEDLDGDGRPDLVAADPGGTLYLYAWSGTSFPRRTAIGPGWTSVERLV